MRINSLELSVSTLPQPRGQVSAGPGIGNWELGIGVSHHHKDTWSVRCAEGTGLFVGRVRLNSVARPMPNDGQEPPPPQPSPTRKAPTRKEGSNSASYMITTI